MIPKLKYLIDNKYGEHLSLRGTPKHCYTTIFHTKSKITISTFKNRTLAVKEYNRLSKYFKV